MNVNKQPIEKRVHSDVLDVQHVWDTIQGEGPFAGIPAIFVRLAGCTLLCPGCDSDYTSRRKPYTPEALADKVDSLQFGSKRCFRSLVVITGGEPFRQDLQAFCTELVRRQYRVQIETNGTIGDAASWLVLNPGLITIICSPKTPNVANELRPYINSWKYILEAGFVDDVDGLPTSSLGYGYRVARPGPVLVAHPEQIYVQPLDVGGEGAGYYSHNKRHIEAAVASCMKFGYRLSVQQHKIIGLE